MLFPALGLTAAMWLLMGPLTGVETGARAALTVGVGVLVLALGPLSVRNRTAGWAVAALGGLLGFANLVMSAPILSCASLATCAVALVAAGAAPEPVVIPANAASITPIGAKPAAASEQSNLVVAA